MIKYTTPNEIKMTNLDTIEKELMALGISRLEIRPDLFRGREHPQHPHAVDIQQNLKSKEHPHAVDIQQNIKSKDGKVQCFSLRGSSLAEVIDMARETFEIVKRKNG